MDSGTLGANESNSREKHRWGESQKVYTRKIHHQKALKTNTTATNITSTTTTENNNAATATAENSNNDNNNTKNQNDNVLQQSSQTLATEDANSAQQQQPRFDMVSDDSSSHNLPLGAVVPNGREPCTGNGAANGAVKSLITRVDDRVRINLGAAVRSKNGSRELRKNLFCELGEVRSLIKKLEAKEVQLIECNTTTAGGGGAGDSHSQYSGNGMRESTELVRLNSDLSSLGHHDSRPGNGLRERTELVRLNSKVGSLGPHDSRPSRQLSVLVMENNHNHGVVGEFVEKEKRTPKANQYYQNSDFLLGKDRLPPETNKKLKSNGGKKHGGGMSYGFGIDKNRNQMLRACNNLLQRLMKHKHGWVFNEPVNAHDLGLHDYHDIIKHPMDLGTIKTRLAQNWYKSPREFAEDVRLTFHNAMTYNPKGQDVHIMADELLKIFEERWVVIETEYNPDWWYQMYHDAGLPTPFTRKAPPVPPPLTPVPQMRTLDRSESVTTPVDSMIKSSYSLPVGRTPVPKKPKAKDLNKRDMTFEEKQRLSTNLQSLPSEKLDAIVQIIKRRNTALCQHDDEIEVDIDSVDAETLWELDRFVTNYKKSLSKYKRKAELALQARTEVSAIPAMNPAPAVVEAQKKSKIDETNVASSSPVQGEKQGDNASRSSSSSSSSSDSGSSSSESDSDSSSAHESDAGHSPKA
ncbi:unnamed protein product [Ilex paraguariensis]|uniref:Transcription factor GTE4-like n=1 Tax=Ilex paraguariensis TaxID=185542 RepID=A0ABC8QNJ6_9AQUA